MRLADFLREIFSLNFDYSIFYSILSPEKIKSKLDLIDYLTVNCFVLKSADI
jgi:hypothetical protein